MLKILTTNPATDIHIILNKYIHKINCEIHGKENYKIQRIQ